jgi:hypothetical protein
LALCATNDGLGNARKGKSKSTAALGRTRITSSAHITPAFQLEVNDFSFPYERELFDRVRAKFCIEFLANAMPLLTTSMDAILDLDLGDCEIAAAFLLTPRLMVMLHDSHLDLLRPGENASSTILHTTPRNACQRPRAVTMSFGNITN